VEGGNYVNPELVERAVSHRQIVAQALAAENSLRWHLLQKHPRGPFGYAQGRLFDWQVRPPVFKRIP
jgi:hypothetical protein